MASVKSFSLCTLLLFCMCVDVGFAQITGDDLTVDAGDLGKIRGKIASTLGASNRQYVSFLGLRYGQPPTGTGRFKPSIRSKGKLNSTGDTFYATTDPPSCSQPTILLPVKQAEDCLFLNVYTPNPNASREGNPLPVIFFIHGGAFAVGQGHTYGGQRLLNKDVILVSPNYRLGVLGFFSLMSESVPGNAGLYDIINALKWTKDYIKYFGGDPEQITIAGQSAGSVAVTHLLASPLARGYFSKAIGSSGSALAAWGTTEDPMDTSLKIADMCGCHNSSGIGYDLKNITECMQTVDAKIMIDALYNYQIEERREGRLGFAAVSPSIQSFDLEPDSSLEKIVPEHPAEVFASGRQANVPLLMGSTRHDGSYVLGVYYNRYLKENGYVNDPEFMSKKAVPAILEALGIPDEYGVYESIAKMYLGDSRVTGEFFKMYPGFIDLFSVFFFKASSYQTAIYQSQLNNKTYWYSFDYKGKQTMFNLLFSPSEIPPFKGGVTHGDDLMYVFQATLLDLDQEGYEVSNRMVNYWTNFATYGNPTPTETSDQLKWTPLKDEQVNAVFMAIDKDSKLSQHYEDYWSEVGWEVVNPTTPSPSSTQTTPRSSSPPSTTEPLPTSSTDRRPSETTTAGPSTTISSTESSSEQTTTGGAGSFSIISVPSIVSLIVFQTLVIN